VVRDRENGCRPFRRKRQAEHAEKGGRRKAEVAEDLISLLLLILEARPMIRCLNCVGTARTQNSSAAKIGVSAVFQKSNIFFYQDLMKF